MEEAVGEPAANGFVVEFEAEPCHENVEQDYSDGHRPCIGEGPGLVFDHPCVEQIHHRIVSDVDREGDVAEEFADGRREAVGGGSGSSYPHQNGEDGYDAQRLVKAVEADGAVAGNVGHGEEHEQYHGAYPESASDALLAEDAREEDAHGEGEQHAYGAGEESVVGHCPAHAQTVAAAYVGPCHVA